MNTLPSPSFSVLISSYNYQDHVVSAVESALAQTLPPHEVIVVDDGSTDESVARLQERFAGHPKVQIIVQPNGGQLSAWITGFRHSSGTHIALLDSDDLWHSNYLASVAVVYQERPTVEFVYCNLELFGAREGLMLDRPWHRSDRDLGMSVLLGSFFPKWQGVATSGNTVTRSLLARIIEIPAPQIGEWITRPDDCLFYGSDILGGHKYYLAAPLARHREHGSNALLADQRSPMRRMRYELRRERMLTHYRNLAQVTPRHLCLAKSEFRTKPTPLLSEWWLYTLMACQAPERLSKRLGQVIAIATHYLKNRF